MQTLTSPHRDKLLCSLISLLPFIWPLLFNQPSFAQLLEFKGYPCTEDCSGHEAGYEWAEENDITDELDCGGNSQSFIEGCIAYVEEQ